MTINTYKGLFQYTRLPYGISSAPAQFQRTMESLLQGIPSSVVYFDDILVTGDTVDESFKNLDQVLERLDNAGASVPSVQKMSSFLVTRPSGLESNL